MGELKFRAFDKISNKMREISKINFSEQEIISYDNPELPFPTVIRRKFKDIVIMQYIGIIDKNSKEIAEGDIIDIHQTVNGQNLFIITFNGLSIVPLYLFGRAYEYSVKELLEIDIPLEDKEIEIIGNIYENPEMIEGVSKC